MIIGAIASFSTPSSVLILAFSQPLNFLLVLFFFSIFSFAFLISLSASVFHLILGLFGFENRILDNPLTPETRKLFYKLQEKKIMLAERGLEPLPYNPLRTWQVHYWIINKKKINYYASTKRKKHCKSITITQDIYATLPEEIWKSRKKTIAA